MLTGIAGAVGAALAAVATPLIVAILAGRIGSAKPAFRSTASGTIAPELISSALTVAIGLLLIGFGLWALATGTPAMKLAGACGVVIGFPIALFMSPSLTRLHAVHWSEEGVEGPSALFGPTLGLARTFARWSDIAAAGQTRTGYWFVETQAGDRVYWSYLYRGHHAFGEALTAHCPGILE